MKHIEDIEFLESARGTKEQAYREQVLDYLVMYSEWSYSSRIQGTLVRKMDENAYRLKLAYFGRFVQP